jgi:hypothetical protein
MDSDVERRGGPIIRVGVFEGTACERCQTFNRYFEPARTFG